MTARLRPYLAALSALATVSVLAPAALADPIPTPDDASGGANAADASGAAPQVDTAMQADTAPFMPCTQDSECEGGWICFFNGCSPPQACSGDLDCWTDNCVDGTCRETASCATDAECRETQICAFGSCQHCGEGCCRTDADCGAGLRCDRGGFAAEDPGGGADVPAPGSQPGVCRVDPDLPVTPDCASLCDAMAPCSVAAATQQGFGVAIETWLSACETACSYVAGTGDAAATLVDRADTCVATETTCAAMQASCGSEVAAVRVQMEQAGAAILLPDTIRFAPLAFPVPGGGPFPDTFDSGDAFGGDVGPEPGTSGTQDEGCAAGGGAGALGLLAALAMMVLLARRRAGAA